MDDDSWQTQVINAYEALFSSIKWGIKFIHIKINPLIGFYCSP
jgi:hypothetical protein